MATRSANDSEQQDVQRDTHSTPVSSYLGVLIGLLLFVAMIMLQAKADPLM